jgi:hypothetical protein
MRESVNQLGKRIDDIEDKVEKVRYILCNQTNGIRAQVTQEKEHWINQFQI